MKDVAFEVKRRRKTGNLPPVYPNGWFHVLNSWEVGTSEVKFVSCLGEHLAVFRGEDGVAHIVDAYCPHLGANLAIGGQVVGNCIQCPFHGWEFEGDDGKCTKIPYSKNIPAVAKIKSWPCLERNESIMLWYHAEGAESSWIPEDLNGIQSGKWVYRGRTTHQVNAHIQEIPENGADLNHLDHLHGSPFLAGTDLRYTFTSKWLEVMRHSWDGSWSVDEDNKHVGKLTLKHEIVVFGFRIPLLDFYLCAKQTGPGIVHMHFSTIFGDGIMIHTVTPEEPLIQRVEHKIYWSRFMPAIVAKFYLYAESIQIERDIMIWNYKRYEAKPLLVKEDNLIGKHRRWYSQFYSENSPQYPAIKNNHLDW
ncbi:cholesterol 7-desaturase-like isoform X2 [Actinia tenebrosa]|nr:cholesterol 7-desaturase-like isoform X2 [Actinia tenebrosa]